MAEEADVIEHLLDVEHEASGLLLDAQKEADARTAESRAKADAQFKEGYAKVTAALEAEESDAKKNIDSIHEQSIEQYRNRLDSSAKDESGFDKLLESVLYS